MRQNAHKALATDYWLSLGGAAGIAKWPDADQSNAPYLSWSMPAGHTAEQIREYLLALVRKQDAARVNVTIVEDRTTGHISPTASPQFDTIARAIHMTKWPNPQVWLPHKPSVRF